MSQILPYPFDPYSNGKGFPLAEDEAMKRKLSGLTLPNPRGPASSVSVWFRMPTTERVQAYPFITIDLLAMSQATDQTHSEYEERSIDRAHRRADSLPSADVWPSISKDIRREYNVAPGVAVTWERFLPFYLMYQVTTHARSYQHHMLLMNRLMQWDMLPWRWGFLDVAEDDTRRWLDNMGHRAMNDLDRDSPGGNKRVFRNIFTVRTFGWVPEFPAVLVPAVREVDIDLEDKG